MSADSQLLNELFDFLDQVMPLSEEDRSIVASLSIFREVKKGGFLLREGERGKESYFVVRGCVRSYVEVEGEEKTTDFFLEMDTINPTTIVSGKASLENIVALEDSLVLISTPETEEAAYQLWPRFERLGRLLTERMLLKNRINFSEFKVLSPEKRYLQLVEKRPELVQRVPQKMLASYLGITPQSLSRLRSRLASKNKLKA